MITNLIKPKKSGQDNFNNIPNYIKTDNYGNIIGEIEGMDNHSNDPYQPGSSNQEGSSDVNVKMDYSNFIDKIRSVTSETIAVELDKYSKVKLMNRYNLIQIRRLYQTHNSFITDDWFVNTITDDDLFALLDTAYEYNFLISIELQEILDSETSAQDFIDKFDTEQINYLLSRQELFNVYIPSKEDLIYFSQFEEFFREFLEDNPDVISGEIIDNLLKEYIVDIYETNHFLGADQVFAIYQSPREFFDLMTFKELKCLLDRVRPYLQFITIEYRANLLLYKQGLLKRPDLLNSEIFDEIINVNEIKQIIDTEVDIKNNVINLMGFGEVNEMFNNFKIELFKNDFKDIITEMLQYNLQPLISENEVGTWILEAIQTHSDEIQDSKDLERSLLNLGNI